MTAHENLEKIFEIMIKSGTTVSKDKFTVKAPIPSENRLVSTDPKTKIGRILKNSHEKIYRQQNRIFVVLMGLTDHNKEKYGF